jgi:hypothetical protein
VILRWEQGRSAIDALSARGRLTRVTPNRALADTLLTQARAHIASGEAIMDTDPAGGFVLVYDAARKALSAILVNQGLRAGGDGAHAVLLDVVLAQLEPPLGTTFRPFTWMRPLRNHTEYPAPDHATAQEDDVREAIPAATAMVEAATKLLDQMPPY